MGTVQGYSDVISRGNLATNGTFQINQRGTFSSWTAAKSQDYISDAWYFSSIGVDFLEAYNVVGSTTGGFIQLRGRGKKGQVIGISSKDTSGFGGMDLTANGWVNNRAPITASAWILADVSSVPVQMSVQPRYLSTNFAGIHAYYAKVNKNKQVDRAVSAFATQLRGGFNYAAVIYVTLLADGDFNVIVSGFQELIGSYKNPPQEAPVHYSEDLARCKRYYQTASCYEHIRAMQYVADRAYFTITKPLPVEMAGTPSTSLIVSNVAAYDGLGSSTSLISSVNTGTMYVVASATSTTATFNVDWNQATYGAQMYNYGLYLNLASKMTV
ncbi:MAG: hypothetical protein WC511_02960 [Candidatus Pacearchaeota archaeon]